MTHARFLITATLLMILIALVLPAPAAPASDPAGDRRAFDAAAERAAPRAGNSYAWARCAGLFRSVKLHAGRAALGEARWTYATQAEGALLATAARVRMRADGQSAASARMAAELDVMALARVYLARYTARAAATGRPWSDDAVWAQDTRACRSLLGEG